MYQDPVNQAKGPRPSYQNPDNQESLAGHWQMVMDAAQQYWTLLSDADVEYARAGRCQLIEVLRRHYGFSAQEADRNIEAFLNNQPKHGLFERMTEINGNLKINQYVSNPAPGPSVRDDQPPFVTPPDNE